MKRTLALTAVLGLLAIPFAVEAQDTEWNRYTLEDLGGVFIRLESNDACNVAGATPAAYEGDVSLKLTESEVGILTHEEMLANPAMPELRVTLECASGLRSNRLFRSPPSTAIGSDASRYPNNSP